MGSFCNHAVVPSKGEPAITEVEGITVLYCIGAVFSIFYLFVLIVVVGVDSRLVSSLYVLGRCKPITFEV